MKFTYYGHSCFKVNCGGRNLLFDPYITPNPLAVDVVVEQVEADYILLSHGHADHVADAVSIAVRTGAQVICNWEIHEWLNRQGVSNTLPMNLGGKKDFDFGTLRCVVAQHSSSLPDGSYGGHPMGFVLTSEEGNLYYAGDTALTMDMQLVPGYAKLTAAILPIGDHFTMGYEDAARAARMLECRQVIGVHYNTFGYIQIDREAAKQHFDQSGLDLLLPAIGATINLSTTY